MAWFPCFPVHLFWDDIGSASCYGFGGHVPSQLMGFFESHTAINVVLDLLVFAIPVPLYFEKGTSTKTKMGLLGLLTLGFLYVMLAT